MNVRITATAAGSALTIWVTPNDDRSPIWIPFRGASGTNGQIYWHQLLPQSLVVSSGSTLGVTSSTAFRLWIVAFDDNDAVRLGVINCLSGTSIYGLTPDGVASSTAEGGSGGADSAQVFYTSRAVTSKPYTVLGYLEWNASGLTAGTWTTTNLNTVQVYGPGVRLPGDRVQSVVASSSSVVNATTANLIPEDDTPPQITEGVQFMTLSITPRSAANVVSVHHNGLWGLQSASTKDDAVFALFNGASNAVQVGAFTNTNAFYVLSLDHNQVAASTSAITFSLRGGLRSTIAGMNLTMNGYDNARYFGGASVSYLTATEYMR